MGISPSRECVGFGIEIELSGIPRDVDVQPRKEWDYKRAGFRALKSAMESQGIGTTMDPINKNGSFMKHPETYEFWHLTQDSSIEPEDKPDASEFSLKTVSLRSYRF